MPPVAFVEDHVSIEDCPSAILLGFTFSVQVGPGVVHVFDVVTHGPHVGPGHVEVRVCVIEPVCPCGHESVCVWGWSGTHCLVVV